MSPLAALSRLGRSIASDLSALRASRRHHRPRPPAAPALVAEVGGGQRPFPRSDVVVDKYVADDFERAGGMELSLARPLVVADGEALPFADGAYDYLIAYHVLEHARRPDVFAAELSRVAAAGVVQVPGRNAELTFGWPFHPWLIDLEGGTLAFHPREGRAAQVGEAVHRLHERSLLFRLAFEAHLSTWYHTVHWTGALPVRVAGAGEAEKTAELDVERTLQVLRGLTTLPLPPTVEATLVDPVSRRPLRRDGNRFVEPGSGAAYPLAGNVPVLVAEARTGAE